MKKINNCRIYMKYIQSEITNYNGAAVNIHIMYHYYSYITKDV